MKHNNLKIIAAMVALTIIGTLLLWQTVFTPTPVEAQTETGANANLSRTITVVGEGTENVEPDTAQVNIGVEIVETDIKLANSKASETIDAIVAALQAQGVNNQNLQTSSLNIWIERPYDPAEGTPSDRVLYHVSNQVNVTIRDLSKVGAILDAVIQAGANNMYGVTFKVADPSVLESDTRNQAMDDARAKAEELAKLAGLKLGDVISVSEIIGSGTGGLYNNTQFKAEGLGGGGGGITPGQLQMTTQLQVVYSVQ